MGIEGIEVLTGTEEPIPMPDPEPEPDPDDEDAA